MLYLLYREFVMAEDDEYDEDRSEEDNEMVNL